MALNGQLVAALSLCFLAAVAVSQTPPQSQRPLLGDEVCTYYTQSGSITLGLPQVFNMMMIEFGKQIQTLNPMVIQHWIQNVDENQDGQLNTAECSTLVQKVSASIQKP